MPISGTRRSLLTAVIGTSIAALGTSAFAQSGGAPIDIPIGAVMALTGAGAGYGLGDSSGLRLAIKEMDAENGFEVAGKRYRFALSEQDSSSQPSQSISATQKLLTEQKVKFIFGPDLSPDFVPAWGVISKSGAFCFTGATAALPYVGQPAGKGLWFVVPAPRRPTEAVVAAAVAKWHPKTAALLYPADAVGTTFGPLFKAALEAHGVKIVYQSTFQPSSRDFSSALTAMSSNKPDMLVTGYFDDVVSTVMRQAVELGVTKNFIGMRGVSEKPGVTMGKAIDSYMFPVATRSVVNPEDADGKAYVASFEKYFGKAPDPSMAPGVGYHDVIWMLAAAMTKAGTVSDLDKIRDALQSVTDYPHATLHLVFDSKGQVDYPQTYGTYDGATGRLTYSVSK